MKLMDHHRIDQKLDDAITKLILQRRHFTVDEVASLVEALEPDGINLCKRVATRTFIVLIAILRQSHPCQGQQRGLYLLIVSHATSCLIAAQYPQEALRDEEAASTQVSSLSTVSSVFGRRKQRVGSAVLENVWSQFMSSKVNVETGRWVSLDHGRQNCKANVEKLRDILRGQRSATQLEAPSPADCNQEPVP